MSAPINITVDLKLHVDRAELQEPTVGLSDTRKFERLTGVPPVLLFI